MEDTIGYFFTVKRGSIFISLAKPVYLTSWTSICSSSLPSLLPSCIGSGLYFIFRIVRSRSGLDGQSRKSLCAEKFRQSNQLRSLPQLRFFWKGGLPPPPPPRPLPFFSLSLSLSSPIANPPRLYPSLPLPSLQDKTKSPPIVSGQPPTRCLRSPLPFPPPIYIDLATMHVFEPGGPKSPGGT